MKLNNSLTGGLAGAVAVTALHEVMRHKAKGTPRMDKLGEQALNKGLEATGAKPLRGNTLFYTTMVGDILTNALYYAIIGGGKKNNTLKRGIFFGLAAGFGGILLPKPMGLNEQYSAGTRKKGALTVGYYLLGGLIAAAVMNALDGED